MKPARNIAFVFAATFALAACGKPAAPAFGGAVVASTDASSIQIAVGTNDFAVGQPRVPILLFNGIERVADAQSITFTAFDLSSDPPTPGWTGEARNFSDFDEIPYWVVSPDIPAAGFWGLGALITLADGSTTSAEFTIEVQQENSAPAIGSQPPATQNRTIESEPDLNKLSSIKLLDPEREANPAFYQITVADAMQTGKPTVVVFSTPAFCTSQICAPVLESVETVYNEVGDAVNFIHLEIFDDFDELSVAPEVDEWGLSSEPWTFVLDSDGKVAARLGGPLAPRELLEALTPLL